MKCEEFLKNEISWSILFVVSIFFFNLTLRIFVFAENNNDVSLVILFQDTMHNAQRIKSNLWQNK